MVSRNKRPKLVVILGPTASGKSGLAVKMAQKFNGEIISADSRQVYQGMNIGTGKITKKEMKGIPHHLLDIVSPKGKFSVSKYRKLAIWAINKILKKGKVPILCGGTGFYIEAVIDGILLPAVKPDWKLRKKLEKKTTEGLFNKLKRFDPQRAKTIDRKNKRRLIRALEIVIKSKKSIPSSGKKPLPYPILMIGIKKTPGDLKKLIKGRLLKRLKRGMIAEVKRLRKSGLSWKKLESFGLEYRFAARYLQGKIDYHQLVQKLQKESEHYAKRQMTWFRRDKRTHWIKDYKEAERLAKKYLNKNLTLPEP